MFFYSDEGGPHNGSFNVGQLDPTAQYIKHFENSLFLTFMAVNGTLIEKHQASKELAICEKKMKFWKKFHSFDGKKADLMSIEAKKKWAA